MSSLFTTHIRNHIAAVGSLVELQPAIEDAGKRITACLGRGNKLLLCGNGGSAADAQHIAAELVGRFVVNRRGLPAIALTTDTSILTSVANDYGYNHVFSRQVEAHAQEGDVLVGISTSGNSSNVIAAIDAASQLGCTTIGLLGNDGGVLKKHVDVPIVIAEPQTAHIQECHIVIGHIWCAMVDAEFLKNPA
ncbi:MAG: D-sedoheptulose 7-phosphate isomerase [Anderseniella sp.]|jgi:phosphoheptose isomerase|nr:D-sedoheptulose 7-phosphate isomerase [Anderseniella sp.]